MKRQRRCWNWRSAVSPKLHSHWPEPPPFEHSDLQMVAEPAAEYAGAPVPDPFEHPDAQRRFRVMHDVAELEGALSYPWEKWAVFLHPVQRQVVEKHFSGPARCVRHSRHWQDCGRSPPSRASRPCQPRCQGLADDLLGHLG